MTKSVLNQDFLFQQPGHCARLVHAISRPYYAKHMAEFDLKPSEFATLSLVHANPGVTQKLVADAVMITPSNMAAIIDKLETRGWLERHVSAQDKRIFQLRLTPDGDCLHARAAQAVLQSEQLAFAALTADEKALLLALMQKILRS